MPIELKIPEAGESITEVQIGQWRVAEGEYVKIDDVVVEIETDKAAMELPAPVSGTLTKILKTEGAEAAVGDLIGLMEEGGDPPAKSVEAPEPPKSAEEPRVMPSAKRVLEQAGVAPEKVEGTGPGGRILKEDAVKAAKVEPPPPPPPPPVASTTAGREEEVVPMTPMRKVIAKNLVAAQQNMALLTTFNEADLSAVIELRRLYKDAFLKEHGVKLGFMSFFVKAAVEALQAVPAVNARVDGTHIVYRKYQDIGIAVGGGRGLVVPILRDADTLTFADIERAIGDFAVRAKNNKISLKELQGGTFTISNGGIYGSMLSTPIVNPPQSGILGIHAIQDRPAAVDGQVVVRPMMYLALTYDHRVVDGREAVTFLKRIKDLIESPERIWLKV